MFITSLNRFFARHSRKTFMTITGVIIVTFVLYFSPGFDLFGLLGWKIRPVATDVSMKNVSREELIRQINSVLINYSLQIPYVSPGNPELREMATGEALRKLTLLKESRKRNIYVDDVSVAAYQKKQPVFQKDGKFDKDLFIKYVNEKLVPVNLDKEDLDMAVRDELILKRLEDEVKAGIIVSPDEVRTAFNQKNEKIKLKVFRFNYSDYLPEIKVDDKDIESFFNSMADNYRIPAKFKARIVRFNYIDFNDKAAQQVKDDEIKDYYEKNKNRYRENNQEQPLEKVADKIKQELAGEKAKSLAMDDGHNFAVEAYSITETGQKKEWLEKILALAAEKKMTVYETDFISADESDIKRVGNEPQLSKDISQLYLDHPVSNAIQGNKAAFVAYLTDFQEERKATLDEVKEKVREDLTKEKALNLAGEKAKNAAVEIEDILSKDTKWEEVEKQFKAEDVTEFTAFSQPPVKDGKLIAKLANQTREGKLSTGENTADGAFFLYVEKKTPPADEDFKNKEKFFSLTYTTEKENAEWQNFIAMIEPEHEQQPPPSPQNKKKK